MQESHGGKFEIYKNLGLSGNFSNFMK